MKKAVKKVTKLIDFLIRVLIKVIKVGTKTLDSLSEAAEKGSKLAPILVEIAAVIAKLEEYKVKINNISEGE